MATVNFSVPEDVKKEFDRAFAGKNKSRVIADLMAQAVQDQLMLKRRSEAIDSLLSRRRTKRPVRAADIRRARESGRS
ncbi:MAG: hypothetical protein IT391_16145 [Nitrospira sp.]|nr:hypothetical protein [Nitrospira sp.]